MYLKLITFLMLFFFVSCNNEKNNTRTIDFSKDQDFRIINVYNEQKYHDLAKRLPDNTAADFETEESYAFYSYMSLRPNKEYTFLIGTKFMHGTYNVISKDSIELISTEFGLIPLKIVREANGCIQIHGDFGAYKSDMMLEIVGNTMYYLNLNSNLKTLVKENDIRSLDMNQWRFPAGKKETDDEIKHRLILNLKYIAGYMRVHLYGEFNQIHTAGIPSPFLFAKNGLFLFEWQRVPYFWKHVFYDVKDAEKAYRMLKKEFDVTEAPPFIDNWLAYNESCLNSLIKNLEAQ